MHTYLHIHAAMFLFPIKGLIPATLQYSPFQWRLLKLVLLISEVVSSLCKAFAAAIELMVIGNITVV